MVVRRALGQPTPGWLIALLTGGALALEPVWQNLTFGQVNLSLMLAVLVDLVLPTRRWSDVLVGLAAGRVFDVTMRLGNVAEGYRAMDERRAIKVLIEP